MTVKKVTAPLSVQKGENTQESEVKALPVATEPEAKEPTPEELKAENERLKQQLSAVPTDLKARVEYFAHKNELIRRLTKLDSDKNILTNHLDNLSEIAAKNDFENEEYYLNIEGGSQYSKKSIYTLKNPVLIGEVLAFVIGKIDSKRENIKAEIEA
jgi:hypothetical protein